MKNIKNPERYIKRLKAKLAQTETMLRFAREHRDKNYREMVAARCSAFGDEWFSWSSPSRLGVNFTQKDTVNRARIGAKVIAIGEVVEFQRSKTGENTAHMDFKTVYIKD
jgi:hypothetical protein